MRRLSLLLLLSLVTLAASCAAAAAAPSLVGQVTEYRLGAGTRPTALTVGPDGNLWFGGIRYESGAFSDVIGKVTPKGKVAEFTIETHQGNLGISDIITGADGNLWFTVGGRSKVGRITPSGAVTEFALPDPGASPMSIAAGADGNLWFTEFRGEKIGRVTPGGEVTEFPLDDAYRIAAGPDGGLWVVNGEAIFRVATDGTYRRFQLPKSIAYPNQIIAGPDGALWFGIQSRFGEGATPGLGRITASGEISQIFVPGGRQTGALSNGPAGAIWYSNGAGRIGWAVPGGATGVPACIRSCRTPITDLVEGPDDKLWFTAGVAPLAPFNTPGTVGTYAPPPREIQLLGDARLRQKTLALPVRCLRTPAGNPCKGLLRITCPGGPVHRSVSLGSGTTRRLAVRLPDAALARLSERGRLVLRATTTLAEGRRDFRRIVLRHG